MIIQKLFGRASVQFLKIVIKDLVFGNPLSMAHSVRLDLFLTAAARVMHPNEVQVRKNN